VDIFDCAIKMEEEAKEYYEKIAAAASVPELKNLFSILAAAEQEHYEALSRMKRTKQPEVLDFKGVEEAACVFKPLLAKRDLMEELKDDPDAYLHVVKEEEASIKLYEDLAAQAENDATRGILLTLADEERKHLNIVENIYYFVEAPRTYLEWREFSNLKPL